MRKLRAIQFPLRDEANLAASRAKGNRFDRHWCPAAVCDLYPDDFGAVEALLAQVLDVAWCTRPFNWAGDNASAALHTV